MTENNRLSDDADERLPDVALSDDRNISSRGIGKCVWQAIRSLESGWGGRLEEAQRKGEQAEMDVEIERR